MSGLFLGLGDKSNRIKTQIWDSKGDEVWKKDGEAHSFNRNIHNIIATQVLDLSSTNSTATGSYGEGSLRLNRTDGTIVGAQNTPYDIGTANDNGSGYFAAVADSCHGIVVGIGTSGFTFEDYQLGGPIISGNGSGQLAHSSSEPLITTFVSSRFSVDYARFFNNNTTASITVTEIGMVARPSVPLSSLEKVLVCRDVLSTTLPIPAGGQLKVTYTFTSPAFTT